MDSQLDEFQAVAQCLQWYFEGLFEADVEKLRSIFHAQATLQAPGIRRTRDQWLELVANRPVPKAIGADWSFKVLSIEIVNNEAMAKVECPLFEYLYIDFLSMLKEEGRWQIVNKMYADCRRQTV